MHLLRLPTEKQIMLAGSLSMSSHGESLRGLSAKIADALEVQSFKVVEREAIGAGIEVEYIGGLVDMPKRLVVSTIAKTGYLYFKGTSKYCQPWDVRVRE